MSKLQTFDSSLIIGQSYFFNDGWQKVMTFTKDDTNDGWSCRNTRSMADLEVCQMKKIKPLSTTNYSLLPKLKWLNSETRVEFKGICSKQNKVTFTSTSVLNLLIVWVRYGHKI